MRFLTATRLVSFLLIAALASTLLVGCSNGAGDERPATPTLDEANLTVEDVYARFAEVVNKPGSIYRATVRMQNSGEPSPGEATSTAWVDVGRNLARVESDGKASLQGQTVHYASTSITANGWLYTHYEQPPESARYTKVEARTCHLADAPVSSVLGCPGPTEKSTTSLEMAEYKGHHAVVLVSRGTTHGEDETTTFTERLYLNASTLLPIALEGEGDTDYGEIYHGSWLYTYQNDFIASDSLPDDFFDPASTGYVEPDPEAPLLHADLGITVYWLGRDFAASSLTPLTLSDVYVPESGQLYGDKGEYRVMLEYNLAGDEFSSRAIMLQEHDLNDWNAWMAQSATTASSHIAGNWWDWPCRDRKDVQIPGGHVTIFFGFQNDTEQKQPTTAAGERACPSVPYDEFMAHVYLGSTVILVAAPGILDSNGQPVDNPYDSAEGMEASARALQPRQ